MVTDGHAGLASGNGVDLANLTDHLHGHRKLPYPGATLRLVSQTHGGRGAVGYLEASAHAVVDGGQQVGLTPRVEAQESVTRAVLPRLRAHPGKADPTVAVEVGGQDERCPVTRCHGYFNGISESYPRLIQPDENPVIIQVNEVGAAVAIYVHQVHAFFPIAFG